MNNIKIRKVKKNKNDTSSYSGIKLNANADNNDNELVTKIKNLSNIDLKNIADYYGEIDYSQITWYEAEHILLKKLKDSITNGHITNNKIFNSCQEAINYIIKPAELLSERIEEFINKNPVIDNKDYLWSLNMVTEGKLNDRLNALVNTLILCPVLHSNNLKSLYKHLEAKNRTEKEAALSNITALWINKHFIPKHVGFTNLIEELEKVKNDLNLFNILIKKDKNMYKIDLNMITENIELLYKIFLCSNFHLAGTNFCKLVLKIMNNLIHDEIAFIRKRTYECLALMGQESQENNYIFSILVQGLADIKPKLGGYVISLLGNIIDKKKESASVICNYIEESIFKLVINSTTYLNRHIKTRDIQIGKKLKRKVKSSRNYIKKLVKIHNDDNDYQNFKGSIKITTKNFHQACSTYLIALSQTVLDKSNEKLASEQLERYIRILLCMSIEPKLSHLLNLQSKQLKYYSKRKNNKNEKSNISINPAKVIDNHIIPYIKSLVYSEEGQNIFKILINGIRRLLPFCSNAVLSKQVNNKLIGGILDVKEFSKTFCSDKIILGVALSNILLHLNGKIHSTLCKQQTYSLIYLLYSRLYSSIPNSIISKIYDESKSINYIQSKSSYGWYKLIKLIIFDYSISVKVRSAMLRRFLTVILVGDKDNYILNMAYLIFTLLIKDESVIKEWIENSFGHNHYITDEIGEYNHKEYNPEKAFSLNSKIYELLGLNNNAFMINRVAYDFLSISTSTNIIENIDDKEKSFESQRYNYLNKSEIENNNSTLEFKENLNSNNKTNQLEEDEISNNSNESIDNISISDTEDKIQENKMYANYSKIMLEYTGWHFVYKKLFELDSKNAENKFAYSIQRSTSALVLNYILNGVSLFKALTHEKCNIVIDENNSNIDYEEVLWTSNVRSQLFWIAADKVNIDFPFKQILVFAIKPYAIKSLAPMDIEIEADKYAAKYINDSMQNYDNVSDIDTSETDYDFNSDQTSDHTDNEDLD